MEDLSQIVFIDSAALPCAAGFDDCDMKERTISFADFVEIPVQEVPPAEVFKECCYYNIVLASSTDTDLEKNDFAGVYHQREIQSETNEFVLIRLSDSLETVLNDDTFGTFQGFGSIDDNPDLTTMIVEWRLVLAAQGADDYKIVKRLTRAGVSVEVEFLVYTLREFSDFLANGTVRMDVTMSGLLEKDDIDFSGSNFADSLRLPGFFGRREPTFEEDNIVNRNYVKRQISSQQTNVYQFQANQLPYCVTDMIWDFFLFSDDIRMFDYNLNNHSYQFKNFPVKLANNVGTTYRALSRKATLNLEFNDKTLSNNKRNF